MIGVTNPNRPACSACGDECSEEELSIDHPGLCICCASDVQADVDAERAADFQSLSAEWFELVAHRQSVAYLEWVDVQKSDSAIAKAAGMAAE